MLSTSLALDPFLIMNMIKKLFKNQKSLLRLAANPSSQEKDILKRLASNVKVPQKILEALYKENFRQETDSRGN